MIEAEKPHDDEMETDEYFARVMTMAEDIAETLDDYEAGPVEALATLSFVAAGVLTCEVPSRKAAMALLDTLVSSVKQGIDAAEENGTAWWVNNRIN